MIAQKGKSMTDNSFDDTSQSEINQEIFERLDELEASMKALKKPSQTTLPPFKPDFEFPNPHLLGLLGNFNALGLISRKGGGEGGLVRAGEIKAEEEYKRRLREHEERIRKDAEKAEERWDELLTEVCDEMGTEAFIDMARECCEKSGDDDKPSTRKKAFKTLSKWENRRQLILLARDIYKKVRDKYQELDEPRQKREMEKHLSRMEFQIKEYDQADYRMEKWERYHTA